MPLSEHVYCVAVTFKMTEWVEQRICIKFFVKLEHPSTETIGVIQKAAMGNWCFTASSWQHVHSCIMSYADFLGNIKSPRWLSPSIAQIWPLWLLAFPKTKIIFEREKISDCQWDSRKYDRASNSDWETFVKSQGAYFEGDWGIIVLCTTFLVS